VEKYKAVRGYRLKYERIEEKNREVGITEV
jgi:hypothetical protein